MLSGKSYNINRLLLSFIPNNKDIVSDIYLYIATKINNGSRILNILRGLFDNGRTVDDVIGSVLKAGYREYPKWTSGCAWCTYTIRSTAEHPRNLSEQLFLLNFQLKTF